MPSRLTSLMILAGGLYLAPFLAGLSRHPAWTVAAFAGFLALWGVLYRSGPWPRRLADLAQPAVLAATLMLLCMMLGIAGLFFLAGRGLSMLTGVMPLPIPLLLALPIASLVAAVLVLSPRKSAEMDRFLDDALHQVQGMTVRSGVPARIATSEALIRRLQALPEDARPEEVQDAIGRGLLETGLLEVIDRLGTPPPRSGRIAAILLATDLEEARGLAGRAEAEWVFDLARGDPELEALFAARALALLNLAPDLWTDLPYTYDVQEAAQSSSNADAARLLAALRDRLSELSLASDELAAGLDQKDRQTGDG